VRREDSAFVVQGCCIEGKLFVVRCQCRWKEKKWWRSKEETKKWIEGKSVRYECVLKGRSIGLSNKSGAVPGTRVPMITVLESKRCEPLSLQSKIQYKLFLWSEISYSLEGGWGGWKAILWFEHQGSFIDYSFHAQNAGTFIKTKRMFKKDYSNI
jgi:hypothetical protein